MDALGYHQYFKVFQRQEQKQKNRQSWKPKIIARQERIMVIVHISKTKDNRSPFWPFEIKLLGIASNI